MHRTEPIPPVWVDLGLKATSGIMIDNGTIGNVEFAPVNQVHLYDKIAILYNIIQLLITVIVVLVFIYFTIVNLGQGKVVASQLLFSCLGVIWIALSSYGFRQYISLFLLPFAICVQKDKIEFKTISSLLNPEVQTIEVERSALQGSAVSPFGISLRNKSPVLVNGKVFYISKLYLIWKFVKNGNLISKEIAGIAAGSS